MNAVLYELDKSAKINYVRSLNGVYSFTHHCRITQTVDLLHIVAIGVHPFLFYSFFPFFFGISFLSAGVSWRWVGEDPSLAFVSTTELLGGLWLLKHQKCCWFMTIISSSLSIREAEGGDDKIIPECCCQPLLVGCCAEETEEAGGENGVCRRSNKSE